MDRKAFTMIELLIAIAIATVIVAAVYFSLDTALESWGYSRDNLALQKVLSEVINETVNGTASIYGIRDSLEIISAGVNRIEFVPPWTDDTHTVASADFIYTLNRKIKPGTALPIAEIKLPEAKEYQLVPVAKIELEDSDISQVRLGLVAPRGSGLRFTYHPDAKKHPDVIKVIWWDSETKQIYMEDIGGMENISKNPFGVKIINMTFKYYDNANNLITNYEWIDQRDINMITGVEVYIEASMEEYIQSLVSFANLRNAPMRSGYLPLSEGTRILIPDSKNIHTLLLTNISGVSNGDELQIEATPAYGKAWRVNAKFNHLSGSNPIIESYTIEYPQQHPVYIEYPRSSTEVGLNLLTLGANGLYDYDDDEDIQDFVMLDGDVMLEVKKMDVEGAGLFIRP